MRCPNGATYTRLIHGRFAARQRHIRSCEQGPLRSGGLPRPACRSSEVGEKPPSPIPPGRPRGADAAQVAARVAPIPQSCAHGSLPRLRSPAACRPAALIAGLAAVWPGVPAPGGAPDGVRPCMRGDPGPRGQSSPALFSRAESRRFHAIAQCSARRAPPHRPATAGDNARGSTPAAVRARPRRRPRATADAR
jgi:hypothetical protein